MRHEQQWRLEGNFVMQSCILSDEMSKFQVNSTVDGDVLEANEEHKWDIVCVVFVPGTQHVLSGAQDGCMFPLYFKFCGFV